MNNFYRKLNIPFDIITPDFPKQKGTFEYLSEVTMFDYDTHNLDSRFLLFIRNLGIDIFRSEIFYNPPHTQVPIHVDTDRFSNMMKINIHVGGPCCVINWYNPLPEFINKPTMKTPLDTEYLVYEEKEVELVHQENIHHISFMNAGIPHGYINDTDQPSWILSLAMLKDNTNLQFQDALSIFKDYIEE